MHYDGPIYRPPIEANTLLLQVTVGCAHNECSFCNMYHSVNFRKESLKQIEEDLIEARSKYKFLGRIFLINGDAFVLKADYLKEIALLIRKYFPMCQVISMYASIQNIRSKTDEGLRELKSLGINYLYIGVESGDEDVVNRINKGHTAEEARLQLKRLNEANIKYNALLMLGVAGKGNGDRNAKATAAFLNETKPNMVWVGTLGVNEGTRLYEEIQSGDFVETTELENILELKTLLNHLQLENIFFYGIHPTNIVPVSGVFPRDRQKMLDKLDSAIEEYGIEALSKTYKRRTL